MDTHTHTHLSTTPRNHPAQQIAFATEVNESILPHKEISRSHLCWRNLVAGAPLPQSPSPASYFLLRNVFCHQMARHVFFCSEWVLGGPRAPTTTPAPRARPGVFVGARGWDWGCGQVRGEDGGARPARPRGLVLLGLTPHSAEEDGSEIPGCPAIPSSHLPLRWPAPLASPGGDSAPAREP